MLPSSAARPRSLRMRSLTLLACAFGLAIFAALPVHAADNDRCLRRGLGVLRSDLGCRVRDEARTRRGRTSVSDRCDERLGARLAALVERSDGACASLGDADALAIFHTSVAVALARLAAGEIGAVSFLVGELRTSTSTLFLYAEDGAFPTSGEGANLPALHGHYVQAVVIVQNKTASDIGIQFENGCNIAKTAGFSDCVLWVRFDVTSGGICRDAGGASDCASAIESWLSAYSGAAGSLPVAGLAIDVEGKYPSADVVANAMDTAAGSTYAKAWAGAAGTMSQPNGPWGLGTAWDHVFGQIYGVGKKAVCECYDEYFNQQDPSTAASCLEGQVANWLNASMPAGYGTPMFCAKGCTAETAPAECAGQLQVIGSNLIGDLASSLVGSGIPNMALYWGND
ncbi:MAG: hypothetical protein VCC02_08105 [Myxococcota bacterium]